MTKVRCENCVCWVQTDLFPAEGEKPQGECRRRKPECHLLPTFEKSGYRIVSFWPAVKSDEFCFDGEAK